MGSSASSERRRTNQQRTVPNQRQQAPPQPQQQHRYPAQQQQPQRQAPPQQQAPPPQQQQRGPQGGAVSEAQSIKNEGTVMVESVKYDPATCILSFTTNCNIPCEYEVHVAVRVDVMHGSVMITPNKPKAPPPRLPVAAGEQHHEVPLDLTGVSEQEQKYLLEYPKQVPVVVALYYTAPPSADGSKPANGDASVSEYTMVQLLPQGKFLKQLLRTSQGVFKIENMFGGEHADVGTVVDPTAQRSESPQADATAGVVDDEDEDGLCVICLTNEKTTVVIPCRHLCLCKECAEELRQKGPKCPVCRGPLNQLVSVK